MVKSPRSMKSGEEEGTNYLQIESIEKTQQLKPGGIDYL